MKKTGIILAILMLIGSFYANGQSTSSIRLNEVLVINVDNFVDAYGSRNGWIELYNNSPGTVDIRGCYITNDKNDPKKYMIPKGDVKTKIPPRQHVLFWADNNPSHGTFHLNFKLDPDKENELFFYDSDGRTLIDHVIVPAGQQPDVSYGLSVDGVGTWGVLSRVTPDTNNKTLDSNEKIENFKQNDSWGVGMTLTAMTVVFLGLLVLFIVFKQVGKSAIKMSRQRAEKAAGGRSAAVGINESGEVFAAIATALYEVTEDIHDLENRVLTIHKVTRNYSPWSSKIYGLRSIPSKK